MIFIFGKRFYGRVDDVPGFFHVSTQFFHAWYIPLIPIKSMVVLSRDKNSIQGVSTSLNFKSIAATWIQAALIGACIIAIGAGIVFISEDLSHSPPISWPKMVSGSALILLGAGLGFFAWYTQRINGFGRAKYERAVQIAERLGFTEEALVRLELAFGNITPEDAEKALANLGEIAEEEERVRTGTAVSRSD